MKRFSPAADEEQRTGMVPPPPAAADEIVGDPTVERQYPSSPRTKQCWRRKTTRVGLAVIICTLVFIAFLIGTKWIHLDAAFYSSLPANGLGSFSRRGRAPGRIRSATTAPLVPISFSCGNDTLNPTTLCRRPSSPPSSSSSQKQKRKQYSPGVPPPWCPDYFRHIHADLEPWHARGITRDLLERAAQPHAEFRLVVVSGRAYIEKYRPSFQTRDVFTQWGFLQLLARYPGRVPDVDIMFSSHDIPRVRVTDYIYRSAKPLFRYSKDETVDIAILWPDWSFWGWPEVNIRPWATLMEDIVQENARLRWPDREPYAFWKGNPEVSTVRRHLVRCNNDSAAGKDWNARLFTQDWDAASRNGFKDSNLAKQCQYRYKIYVQGRSWSVSEKYILACDSPMLAIDTKFKDFFSRGLIAGKHYWPINPANKCRAIKFAVDSGNTHPTQAQLIGEEGSRFAMEEMSMDYLYDYMLHVLKQYAALLRYKHTVPKKAVELCPESLACPAQGRDKEFMMQSREGYKAEYEPCTLPPPFTFDETGEMAAQEEDVRSKVVKMEREVAAHGT